MKFKLIKLFFLLIVVSACSDDDSSSTSNQEGLVGDWEVTEFKLVTTTSDAGAEFTEESSTTLESCDPTPVFRFENDGSFDYTSFDVSFDSDQCSSNGTFTGSWMEVSGSTYELTADGETNQVEINFQTNNQASIIYEEVDGNVTEEVTYSISRL